MSKSKQDNGVLIYRAIIALVVMLAVGGIAIAIWSQKPKNEPVTAADNGKVVALAECLSSKGLKMYGTYWCSHCQAQKKAFGAAFEKVNYIECSEPDNQNTQLQVCKDAGIKGYPTWVTTDGSMMEGPQTFKALADKVGCEWTE